MYWNIGKRVLKLYIECVLSILKKSCVEDDRTHYLRGTTLFQGSGLSKGTPSILLFFDFGNHKLDINRWGLTTDRFFWIIKASPDHEHVGFESCWELAWELLRVTLRVVGESPGEFVSKLMKDMLSGQTQSALFERAHTIQEVWHIKGNAFNLAIYWFW